MIHAHVHTFLFFILCFIFIFKCVLLMILHNKKPQSKFINTCETKRYLLVSLAHLSQKLTLLRKALEFNFYSITLVGYLTQPPKNCLTEGCEVGECVRQGYDYVCKQGKCVYSLSKSLRFPLFDSKSFSKAF